MRLLKMRDTLMQAPLAAVAQKAAVGKQLARDTSGATAVVTGLVFTGLVGFVGLGTETGLWYYTHRTMQSAADSGALSAAAALQAGSANGYVGEAKAAAASYGFTDGVAGVTVTVHQPPASGNYTGNANAVEVIVQQAQTALFSAAFLSSGPTISARAVALQGAPGTGCVLALDAGASAATFGNGTTNVDLVKCGLYVNSNSSSALTLVGNARIEADSVSIVGNLPAADRSSITSTQGITTGAAPAADPYQNVQVPQFTGCDHSNFSAPKTGTLSPGVYCNGLSVTGNANVQLSPGTYIIDRGSFSVAGGSTVTGDGVTLVLTNSTGASPATVSIHGGATIDLSAPTSGAMAGIAFFQDRNGIQGTGNDFSGGTTQSITGAIYFPKETVSFAGGTNTNNACLQLIADEIDFKGNANFAVNCAGKGTRSIGSSSSKLVE